MISPQVALWEKSITEENLPLPTDGRLAFLLWLTTKFVKEGCFFDKKWLTLEL